MELLLRVSGGTAIKRGTVKYLTPGTIRFTADDSPRCHRGRWTPSRPPHSGGKQDSHGQARNNLASPVSQNPGDSGTGQFEAARPPEEFLDRRHRGLDCCAGTPGTPQPRSFCKPKILGCWASALYPLYPGRPPRPQTRTVRRSARTDRLSLPHYGRRARKPRRRSSVRRVNGSPVPDSEWSLPRAVSKVVKRYRWYAKDERVPVMRHAQAAGIPAAFPVVSVDQVGDSPDQSLFSHGPRDLG